MRVVLGIDAAWTLIQPSGVALVAESAAGWRLIAVESSYQRFQALADKRQRTDMRPVGSPPDVPALLNAASELSGRPDLIAIDCPWRGRQSLDDELQITLFPALMEGASAGHTLRVSRDPVPSATI
jgi:hypothetical protein